MAGASTPTIRSFNRYELKYLVHASQIDGLVADISHQMAPDPHGDASGSYVISSLYYDSSELHMLRSKIVGSNPCDSSQRAATSPPGPAPITATLPVTRELSHGYDLPGMRLRLGVTR